MAEQNSLRSALDSIMGTPSAATEEAPSGRLEEGLAPPKQASDVNLATTADVSNLEYTPPPSPFEAELATVQAQNADLSAQLSASIAARPSAPVYTPTAYTSYTPPAPVQFNTLSYKAPAAPKAAPAPAPVPYGQGNQTYIYQSPYTAASQPQYGYEHFYNSNPYYK